MNNTGQQMDLGERTTPSPTSMSNSSSELSPSLRIKLLSNEMRSIRNRGFHDGYDEGKRANVQKSFDTGYEKAFEQNFILSTLKGVANALKSSYNLKHQQQTQHDDNHRHQNQRPSSVNYSTATTSANPIKDSSTPSSMVQTPSNSSTDSTASSSPKSASMISSASSTSSSPSSVCKGKKHHHRHSTGISSSKILTQKYLTSGSSSGRRSATSTASSSAGNDNRNAGDYATKRLSSISSGNVSSYGNFSSNNVVNVDISSNHLSLLESMRFDGTTDIESLKNDLIRICRENRLEILAHYVSQIG